MKLKSIALVLVMMFGFSATYAQTTNGTENASEAFIKEYDQYNPMMGGTEIRLIDGVAAQGYIKDYYPNGQIKHKGYYVDGQLTSVYKNFYPDGTVERDFKKKDVAKSQLRVYHQNSEMKTKVIYCCAEPLIWEEYYTNGQLEFCEKFDKRNDHHVALEFYYFDGTPMSSMNLVDNKSLTYEYKEYFQNGQVKESGTKVFMPTTGDYEKTGTWLVYDAMGNKVGEESFYNGNLADDIDE